MSLIMLLRIVLLPVLVVLALLYGVVALMVMRVQILDGYDRTLRAITGTVAAFVDPAEHQALMNAQHISGIATTEGGVFAINQDGQLMILDMSDEDKLGMARAIWTPPNDARLHGALCAGPSDTLYAHAVVMGKNQLWALRVKDNKGAIEIEKDTVLFNCPANQTQLLWDRTTDVLYTIQKSRNLHVVNRETGTISANYVQLTETVLGMCFAQNKIMACNQNRWFSIDVKTGECTDQQVLSFTMEEGETEDEMELTEYDVELQSGFGVCAWNDSFLISNNRLYVFNQEDYRLSNVGYPGFRDESDLIYQSYVQAFNGIRNDTGVTYLYSFILSDQGTKIVYTLDANNYADDEGNTLIGTEDEDEASTDISRAWFMRSPSFAEIHHWEEWGWIKSAFWPIFDHDGNTIGLIGADISADDISKKMNQALIIIGALQVAMMLLVLLVTVLTSRKIARKIEVVKDAALMLAAGRFDQYIADDLPPELKDVAKQLNTFGTELMNVEQENMWKSERYSRV